MAKRKSTGKRTRFEVFKRDNFTCQYCGAQPPAVVLVVDHITPVSEGGDNDIANLLTACETCNQGKSDRCLDHVQSKPDADVLYLEMQQEIAELRRYQQSKAERDTILREIVADIQNRWLKTAPYLGGCPADHVIMTMLDRYSPEVVEEGLMITLGHIMSGGISFAGTRWIPYTYGVMRNLNEAE